MQIVINISKKLYDRYKEKEHIKRCDIDEFEKALDNCIILPKGHGRLIDVGQCDRELFYQQCGGADALITVKSAFDMLMSLPTIKKQIQKGSDKE